MYEFSVLLPVYWKEDPARFSAALASIFNGTIAPTEVVLVCDGPLTQCLDRIIDSYSHYSNVKIIRLGENQGIVKALNSGLAEITTDIVIRCDSDDINHPERFQKLIAKIADGFDVVGSQTEEINDSGRKSVFKRLPTEHKAMVYYAKRRNPINHMTVAFRTACVRDLGGYPDVYLKEDYALWGKLIGAGRRLANLDETLVKASGGIEMYARRGGTKAALSELKLQRILVENKVSLPLEAIFLGAARLTLLLSPGFLRALIYRIFLRRSV